MSNPLFIALRCMMPRFDGVILSEEWKETLWDRFVMAAPRPRTPSEGCDDVTDAGASSPKLVAITRRYGLSSQKPVSHAVQGEKVRAADCNAAERGVTLACCEVAVPGTPFWGAKAGAIRFACAVPVLHASDQVRCAAP